MLAAVKKCDNVEGNSYNPFDSSAASACSTTWYGLLLSNKPVVGDSACMMTTAVKPGILGEQVYVVPLPKLGCQLLPTLTHLTAIPVLWCRCHSVWPPGLH